MQQLYLFVQYITYTDDQYMALNFCPEPTGIEHFKYFDFIFKNPTDSQKKWTC